MLARAVQFAGEVLGKVSEITVWQMLGTMLRRTHHIMHMCVSLCRFHVR